jgi:hypothetical protein
MNEPSDIPPNATPPTAGSGRELHQPDPPLVDPFMASGTMLHAGRALHKPDPPLGEVEGDRKPITSLAAAIEAVLREPRRVLYQLTQPQQGRLTRELLLLTLLSSYIYGLVVGTFSGGEQLLAAPVKIAGGLLLSAVICLPSLYIFSCLSGARASLSEVCGLFAAFLALTTILLVGFAPVAWVFSQSTASVATMGALHLLFWFIATAFGLRLLERGFYHFGAQGAMMRIWTAIFVLVALQMTTALRPLVGTAPTLLPATKQFFLAHWMEAIQ